MTSRPHENAPDDGPEAAPDLSGPAYPSQPADADRPFPLRRMPDQTQDPDDWNVAGTEPSDQREPDDVVAERQRHEKAARGGDDAERDAALRTGTEHESGYSTELEQGAAQPRPEATAFRPDDDG